MAQMATKQPKRRQYRTGSIVADGPGRWLVRASLGRNPQTGGYMQRSRTVYGTKADAEAALDQLRVNSGSAQSTSLGAKTTLNDLIARYFERGSKLQPGTRRAYQSLWSNYVRNGIGQKEASRVNAYDFTLLWEQMHDLGKSPSTIYSTYALLKASYRAAAKFDEFEFNTARFVVPQKPAEVIRPVLPDEVLVQLIAAAAVAGDPWPLLVRLALATGARRGELLALRWSSLSDDNQLAIRHGIEFDNGELVLTDTKSKQPRTIALDEESAARLRHEKERARQICRSALGAEVSDDGFVFAADPSGVTPRRPDRISHSWRVLLTRAGGTAQTVELRAMRNWHATTLHNEFDYSLESIARRLGHTLIRSETKITQRYIDTSRERDRRMANDIARRIGEIENLATDERPRPRVAR